MGRTRASGKVHAYTLEDLQEQLPEDAMKALNSDIQCALECTTREEFEVNVDAAVESANALIKLLNELLQMEREEED